MRVFLERSIFPCVQSDVVKWHNEHGWCWNVVEAEGNRAIGVFYCTLLYSDGCIIHCDTVPGLAISPATVLFAMRKCLAKVAGICQVVYATVPASNHKLIRCLIKLGFGLTDGGYQYDGNEIVLLKYFKGERFILTQENS